MMAPAARLPRSLRSLPRGATRRRRATVPIRALLGGKDFAVHPSLVAPATAIADDYAVELVAGCGHFLPEEAPDLVRARITELAADVHARAGAARWG
jgi:pimeloyl-ACP methyl ester carboxylesterase